jgi:hypothetical protein
VGRKENLFMFKSFDVKVANNRLSHIIAINNNGELKAIGSRVRSIYPDKGIEISKDNATEICRMLPEDHYAIQGFRNDNAGCVGMFAVGSYPHSGARFIIGAKSVRDPSSLDRALKFIGSGLDRTVGKIDVFRSIDSRFSALGNLWPEDPIVSIENIGVLTTSSVDLCYKSVSSSGEMELTTKARSNNELAAQIVIMAALNTAILTQEFPV